MSRYRFIEAQRDHYPVRLLCQLVAVQTSGCYAWQQTQQQVKKRELPAWEEALVKVFGGHKRCYGTRRLRVALRKKGYRVGWQRLRAAMRRRGLRALQPKAFTPRTTDSTHGLRCAPNRLLNQPKPTQVWGSSSKRILLANWFWGKKAIFGGILTASAHEPTPPTQHACSAPNAPGSASGIPAWQSLHAVARHPGHAV